MGVNMNKRDLMQQIRRYKKNIFFRNVSLKWWSWSMRRERNSGRSGEVTVLERELSSNYCTEGPWVRAMPVLWTLGRDGWMEGGRSMYRHPVNRRKGIWPGGGGPTAVMNAPLAGDQGEAAATFKEVPHLPRWWEFSSARRGRESITEESRKDNIRRTNAGSVVGQRRRRWPTTEPAFCLSLKVFAQSLIRTSQSSIRTSVIVDLWMTNGSVAHASLIYIVGLLGDTPCYYSRVFKYVCEQP